MATVYQYLFVSVHQPAHLIKAPVNGSKRGSKQTRGWFGPGKTLRDQSGGWYRLSYLEIPAVPEHLFGF